MNAFEDIVDGFRKIAYRYYCILMNKACIRKVDSEDFCVYDGTDIEPGDRAVTIGDAVYISSDNIRAFVGELSGDDSVNANNIEFIERNNINSLNGTCMKCRTSNCDFVIITFNKIYFIHETCLNSLLDEVSELPLSNISSKYVKNRL